MKDELVMVQAEAPITYVTLNRPEKRNALNTAMVRQLIGAMNSVGRDSTTGVVVLRGAGTAFCAGGDLAELGSIGSDEAQERREYFVGLERLTAAIRRLPQLTIAAVHGGIVGFGVGLCVACDVVVAHRDATFRTPEILFGSVGVMVAAELARGGRTDIAMNWLTSGSPSSSLDAQHAGIVTEIALWDSWEDFDETIRERYANVDPAVVIDTKRTFQNLQRFDDRSGAYHAAIQLAVDGTAETDFNSRIGRHLT